jgi:hypothetical protein
MPCFYVVARNGRRVSPKDNWTYQEADDEACRLRLILKKWMDSDANSVQIIKTVDPSTIY